MQYGRESGERAGKDTPARAPRRLEFPVHGGRAQNTRAHTVEVSALELKSARKTWGWGYFVSIVCFFSVDSLDSGGYRAQALYFLRA